MRGRGLSLLMLYLAPSAALLLIGMIRAARRTGTPFDFD